tara:strand:- start:4 stop:255 length:252 start_codon:yes stop_codon:yes gene_type:complete
MNLDNYNKNNDKKFGFWQLIIVSYLLISFLPFSILFCVLFYGLDETIQIIKAVFQDILIAFIGLFLGVISLIIIFIIVLSFIL